MPCDTIPRRKNQTLTERKEEVKAAVTRLEQLLQRNKITPRVGPQGAIVFEGWTEEERQGVTDACAYRRIMVEGSALSRHMIARAEQLAGRGVDRRVLASGVHSHDGGRSWHSKG